MHHGASLIYTIAAALGMALILGFAAARLRLPALVGYLLAGVIIGPYTPGFVADPDIAAQLAEIGVMLLMFGVGLHFSLDDLLAVRKIALPGAIVQIGAATLMGVGLTMWWGWSLGAALVFGLSLSVASTVVLLRALENLGILDTHTGRIAVGWLVVEDLAMVLVLVLLPPLAGVLGGQVTPEDGVDAGDVWRTLGITLLQVGGFVALMLVVGRRVFPWVLWQVTRTGSRELFTLCVVAAAVSIAFASSALFGVSFALGAFFAGMVMRESEFSHRAAEESLPLRDAFAVIFFVSVGMLFNPAVLLERPLQVLAVVLVIVVGKSFAACALVLAFRYPLATALTVSASLAQIGEFSFILIALGTKHQMLPPEAQSLVLAGALISIALNPWCFRGIQPIQVWLQKRSAFARRIARELRAQDVPYVIADQNRELIERLREKGAAAVWGDAVEPAVLIQAHIARAHVLVVAIADALNVRQMIETARTLNPQIQIVLRSHNEAEAQLLAQESQATVFLGEQELAQAMARDVLTRTVAPVPTGA